MKDLKSNIDKQIEYNKNKNLFHSDISDIIKFSESTIKSIENFKNCDEEQKEFLINYTVEKTLQEFCKTNQYYSFDEKNRIDLKNIYIKLFDSIIDNNDIEEISKIHYENLKQWIKETNPFSQEIYQDKEATLEPVVCSEYSAELQLKILNIKLNQISDPVLDIGCGPNGNLVKYLSDRNFKAYGIDRFAENFSNIEKVDWLEYNYGIEKWNTIISNLGFSNHFIHNHLRKDGNFVCYAKKYMDILKSLKIGGFFYYAPNLPFIEKYLDTKIYEIKNHKIDNLNIEYTIIKRLNNVS